MKPSLIITAAVSALCLAAVTSPALASPGHEASQVDHQRGRDQAAHHDPVDNDANEAGANAAAQPVDRQRGRDQTAHHDPVDNDPNEGVANPGQPVDRQRGRDPNQPHDPIDKDGPHG
jgi:hypothetical protein